MLLGLNMLGEQMERVRSEGVVILQALFAPLQTKKFESLPHYIITPAHSPDREDGQINVVFSTATLYVRQSRISRTSVIDSGILLLTSSDERKKGKFRVQRKARWPGSASWSRRASRRPPFLFPTATKRQTRTCVVVSSFYFSITF